jgi:hypothetical protein
MVYVVYFPGKFNTTTLIILRLPNSLSQNAKIIRCYTKLYIYLLFYMVVRFDLSHTASEEHKINVREQGVEGRMSGPKWRTCRSQLPRGLRHELSSLARTLGS